MTITVEYDVDYPWNCDFPLVMDFLKSKRETMSIDYPTHNDAIKRRKALKARCSQLGFHFFTTVKDTKLYIAKE